MSSATKTIQALCAVMLLATWPSEARIGETELEIVKRYGPVLKRSSLSELPVTFHRFKEWIVLVTYVNDRSATEVIQGKSEITETAALAMASAIVGRTNWAKARSVRPDTIWVSGDSQATLEQKPAAWSLTIETKAFDAAVRVNEKKRSAGF
jgi:hypothetical protein